MADSKIKEQFTKLGPVLAAGSPADFGKIIQREIAKWGKVINSLVLKLIDTESAERK